MTIWDDLPLSSQAVVDGDQLDDGYFNELGSTILQAAFNQTIIAHKDNSKSTSNTDSYISGTFSGILDYSNSTCFKKDLIAFCALLDEFDDSSIDSGIWSTTASGGTAAVTESGATTAGKQNLTSGTTTSSIQTATTISDGASGLDFRSFSGNSECIITVELITSSGSTDNQAKLQISNGSTHIDIISVANDADFTKGTIRLVFNKTGQTVDYYSDLTLTTPTTNDIDISSVTTNWYLRLFVQKGASSGQSGAAALYTIGYLDGTAGSSIYRTAVETITASTKDFIKIGTFPSQTVALSHDNASAFTTISTNTRITTGITSGTQHTLKVTGTHPTSISATGQNIESIPAANEIQSIHNWNI